MHSSRLAFAQDPSVSEVTAKILESANRYAIDLSLGTGLAKLKGRMFRIGHLGDSNDLTLLATLAGIETGLKLVGVKPGASGVQAAMDHFSNRPAPIALKAIVASTSGAQE